LQESLAAAFDSPLYQIFLRSEGASGYQTALRGKFDLIILDVLLPGKSGFVIAKQLRDNGIDTPILMMSTKNNLSDIMTGFQFGVDGYVCKPFNLHELKCRADALLKRPPQTKKERYEWGELTVDCNNCSINHGDKELVLPNKQYAIFKYLLEHTQTTVSKQELMDTLWDFDTETMPNTIDVHISKLRKQLRQKLEVNSEIIATIHGKGYKLIK
jgi:DNA-binding response OmpR family regulator